MKESEKRAEHAVTVSLKIYGGRAPPADRHRPAALAEGPAPPTAALPGVTGPFPGGPAQQSAPRHTYISLIFSPRPKTKEGTFPIVFP